jgi:hypothetical protein
MCDKYIYYYSSIRERLEANTALLDPKMPVI